MVFDVKTFGLIEKDKKLTYVLIYIKIAGISTRKVKYIEINHMCQQD